MTLKLHDGEVKIYVAEPHWSSLMLYALGALFGLLLIIIMGMPLGMLIMLYSCVGFTIKLVLNRSKTYVITNKRLCLEEGLFSRKQIDIPRHEINDVRVTKGVLHVMFGSGNVVIQMGNNTPKTIKYLGDPNRFKEHLDKLAVNHGAQSQSAQA